MGIEDVIKELERIKTAARIAETSMKQLSMASRDVAEARRLREEIVDLVDGVERFVREEWDDGRHA